MEAVVSAIITPVVESVLGPVKRHLGFLFSSTKYVTDMQSKKRELKSTATAMRKRKEEYDVKNFRAPDLVRDWLEEAEVIDREADGISAGGNGCLHMTRRYKVGKQCSNFIERIDRLMEEKKKKMDSNWINEEKLFCRVDSVIHQVLQDVTQNIFTSRKEIFQRALQLLEPDNTTQKVALCGMGGIGKTTMMEELKKVVENRKLFDHVVKVVIGNSTDPITAIQDEIAQQTGEKLSEPRRETRADRLEKRFLGMSQDGKNKILIILDNLWHIVDLKDIGLASPLPKGFKLFLTSRDERLCRQMDVETSSILRMVELEEAEAKQLFWESAGLSDGDGDHELCKLGEDIVKRCRGLPMAIKTIALALTGQIKDAWKLTLSRLERHNFQDLYDVVHAIFEISYDYLKKVDDKEIFILSGLFPDDFDIPLEDLMRYGWGLKLFDRVLVEARRRTNTSVHNLIRANLLVESDRKGCVKMHDLAHSFVLSNISKFKQASIVNHSDMSEWPTKDTRESCERILLKCKGMSEFPQHFDYPDLKLLKLMIMNDYEDEPLKFPDDFYTRMKQLQVISYRSIRYPSLVPISLQCSTSLRVLCLRSCSLMDDLSSIGQLSNLEILSFAYCGIENLPSAVGKLRKLKLLDLTGCDELCIGDGVFQNLDNLEELYMRNLNHEVISFTEDNCEGLEMVSKKLSALEVEFFENNIRPDNVSFKNLERFRISIGCHLDGISQYDYDKYSYENTLRLVASCEEVHASGINELFEKTEQLDLEVEDINSLEDILMHPSQNSFCNLKHLYIRKCANLKYLFTVNVASTLSNLEILKVEYCPVVGSLIHDENNGAEVIKFLKLERLELRDLPMFVGLCDNINIVMELPQLVELILDELPNITCIFASSNNISATTIPLLNKQVVCPKLEELKICGMKNLKEIWAGEEEYNQLITCIFASSNNISATTIPLLNNGAEVIKFLKLKRLVLRDLPMFVGLCDNINIVMELPQLVRIILADLPNITCIFASSNNISATTIPLLNKEVVCPKLEKLKLFWMTNLKEIWACEEEYDRTPVLKEIEVDECDEIQNLFPKNPMQLPSHLETLTVKRCGSIQALFDIDLECVGQVKSSLRSIEARGLGQLREVWRIRSKDNYVLYVRDFQALENVEIKECENFRNIVTPTTIKFDMGALTTVNIESSGDKWGRNNTSVEFIQDVEFSVPWSLGQYSREIRIRSCHALSTVIPSYAAEQPQKIEVLEIYDCGSMVEVFETKELENSFVFSQVSGGRDDTTLAAIPRLKSITMHKLPNLKELDIEKCHRLVDIFTFSTLGSLGLLEKLSIQYCKQLKVIVREEHGEQTTRTSKAVIFPRLKTIILADLPKLKGFFFGMNKFQLPLSDEVIINRCPQMTVFTPLPLIAPKLKYIHINGGKYCTPECCSFFTKATLPQTPSQSSDNTNSSTTISEEFLSYSHKLIEMLNVRDDQERKEIFSYDELPQLQNLEKLNAGYCESVLEVFDVGTGVGCSNSSHTVVKLPKLRDVSLRFLTSLKYIWKSNGQTILEFPNLTQLSIHTCPQLEHVFTCSMVGSLLQLKELSIRWCRGMEVIVKEDQEEEEGGDGKVNEIRLPCLKYIDLYNLESLKGFCVGNVDYSLPSLDSMKIKECKSLTIFTKGRWYVPKLKVIETSLGFINLAGEQDINSFIITKRQEGFHFGYQD